MRVAFVVNIDRFSSISDIKPLATRLSRKILAELNTAEMPIDPIVVIDINPRVPPILHDKLFFTIATNLNRHGIPVTDSEAHMPHVDLRIHL